MTNLTIYMSSPFTLKQAFHCLVYITHHFVHIKNNVDIEYHSTALYCLEMALKLHFQFFQLMINLSFWLEMQKLKIGLLEHFMKDDDCIYCM